MMQINYKRLRHSTSYSLRELISELLKMTLLLIISERNFSIRVFLFHSNGMKFNFVEKLRFNFIYFVCENDPEKGVYRSHLSQNGEVTCLLYDYL